MPAILDKRVKTLKERGMSESKAWAIARTQLKREGKLKKVGDKRKKR